MDLKRTIRKAILFAILLLTMSNSCEKSEKISVHDSPLGFCGDDILRSMEKELQYIGGKANSLMKNSDGFWEADFGNGIIMIYIPAGSFTMGNNDLNSDVVTQSYPGSPEHTVELNHYWIAKTPVTIEQFRAFVTATNFVTDVEKNGHDGPWVYDFMEEAFIPKQGYFWDNAYKDILSRFPEITLTDKHPVSCVSWNDAINYTNYLCSTFELNFTLPTEAEWEYAARGNDQRVYPWGSEIPDGSRANYADETFNKYFPNLEQALVHFGVNDGYAITSPVGSFPQGKSPFGALDMAGNLTEWVFDAEYFYTPTKTVNPINKIENGIRMQKAGFWAGSAGRIGVTPNEIVFGHNIRSDSRQGDTQNSADDHMGFRIAISYTSRK